MVDGTGMCGSCRVTVGGKMKFACVDGADFDGHLVNFDELQLRQKRFAREEKAAMERFRSESAKLAGFPESHRGSPGTPRAALCKLPEAHPETPALRIPKNIKTIPPERAPMPHQPAEARVHNFNEVALGLDLDGALPRSRTLPALQEAALRSGLPGGHRYPGLHLRAGTQGRRSSPTAF